MGILYKESVKFTIKNIEKSVIYFIKDIILIKILSEKLDEKQDMGFSRLIF